MTNTQVGVLEVFELDRRRAAAGDARQADAAGLVAVVAAVVDVVRAVQPGEELQQEAGLVAAAAAEVPERFVGAAWREAWSTMRSSASSQEIGV